MGFDPPTTQSVASHYADYSIPVLRTEYYADDRSKKHEHGGIYGTYGERCKGVGGRIILEWILKVFWEVVDWIDLA